MMIDPWYILLGAIIVFSTTTLLRLRSRERQRREAYAEYCLIRGFRYEPQQAEGELRFRDVFEEFR